MKTVLIIDDEPLMRETTILMLERAGYKGLGAASAEEGLAMMEANQVGLVLVDVVMPGKNGLELALELNQRWPTTPIVLISGRVSTAADSIRNFNGHFGIKGSIAKPFTLEQLSQAVTSALAD
ncbi:MAG: response regulator [Spirochaetes bacterium]|nr:response regulator [Spirochaetota bacterium]MBU1079888.1 response regulator [Spirochaetota bacterium]